MKLNFYFVTRGFNVPQVLVLFLLLVGVTGLMYRHLYLHISYNSLVL